jgi:uncharacterized membrane protein
MRRLNLWFWLPFLGSALLRLAWFWTQPLWYDENFTLAVTRLPLADMLTAIRGDVHPPLFYLLIRPLALLDLPVWFLRLPSVITGIASLPVAWVVFGKLASDRVRKVAFIIFCLGASGNIFYAQEARMYALLTLLLLSASWALLARRWIWLCVFATALLYTQNYALLYVPSLWLSGLAFDRRTWKPLTLALGLAGLAYLPWLPVLLEQQSNLAGGYWIPPFTPGVALFDLYRSIIQKGAFRMDLFGMVIVYGWIAYAVAWYLLRDKGGGLIAALLGFGPWLLAILGSLILGTSIMHYRSLVPCAPFIILWLSRPLVAPIRRLGDPELTRLRTPVTLLLLIPMLTVSSARFTLPWLILRAGDSGMLASLAASIDTQLLPGDVVYHVGDGSWIDMINYTNHPGDYYKMPLCGPVRGALSQTTRGGLGVQILPLEQIEWRRAWIITAVNPMTPDCEQEKIARWLKGYKPIMCINNDIIKQDCVYLVTP